MSFICTEQNRFTQSAVTQFLIYNERFFDYGNRNRQDRRGTADELRHYLSLGKLAGPLRSLLTSHGAFE